MHHKRFLLATCLALAACGHRDRDPRGVAHDEVLVQIVASGRADTRPDQARFVAGVETIAASSGEASRRNSEVINKVLASLEPLGVRKDDVQTRNVSLSRIGYGPNRGRFQANNMIEIRMRDVERAGEAIGRTTEAGADVLSGPDLVVSDQEAGNRSAYAQAYRAARARAEAYAAAAGLKVARVLVIRDAQEGGIPRPFPYAVGDAVAAEQAAPPPVATGPIVRAGMNESEVNIRVDFALAPR
ncbi:DUF541 domain-containing protein [Sphingomonas parva]|uniref:DUF541 domain-containing protein n=1 Tax=Sphingomonas parva TaxID=2555898 RepID=A0A4Y8ZVB5_9SPHN|nr:SIMPL domain-containing protein [Sphingomonas parva]TFI59417.1 DUF541 domain-containing protein [Sphingomonas parva]